VHNLTVAGFHSYYVEVGGEQILVHNAGVSGACNVQKGKTGVQQARQDLTSGGHNVLGTEVHFRTASGRVRVYDLVTERNGVYYLVEAKKGPRAKTRRAQREKNDEIRAFGATGYGPNAQAAGLDRLVRPGEFVIMTLKYR
jgi:hypothetical protein